MIAGIAITPQFLRPHSDFRDHEVLPRGSLMDTNTEALAEQMGVRIRHARVQAGLSPDDVAQALGITTYNLIAAENGNLKLAAGHIADLCDLFNKRPSWFFSL